MNNWSCKGQSGWACSRGQRGCSGHGFVSASSAPYLVVQNLSHPFRSPQPKWCQWAIPSPQLQQENQITQDHPIITTHHPHTVIGLGMSLWPSLGQWESSLGLLLKLLEKRCSLSSRTTPLGVRNKHGAATAISVTTWRGPAWRSQHKETRAERCRTPHFRWHHLHMWASHA